MYFLVQVAAAYGDIDIVRTLIEAKASPDIGDDCGHTPLYLVCDSSTGYMDTSRVRRGGHGGHEMCASLLIEAGANLGMEDRLEERLAP